MLRLKKWLSFPSPLSTRSGRIPLGIACPARQRFGGQVQQPQLLQRSQQSWQTAARAHLLRGGQIQGRCWAVRAVRQGRSLGRRRGDDGEEGTVHGGHAPADAERHGDDDGVRETTPGEAVYSLHRSELCVTLTDWKDSVRLCWKAPELLKDSKPSFQGAGTMTHSLFLLSLFFVETFDWSVCLYI